MDSRTKKTAKKYNKIECIEQLEEQLLRIPNCSKVEFDLSGFVDNLNQVIILPFYDIDVTDAEYYQKRNKFVHDVISVCKDNQLKRTGDRIEDYGSCLYMVFEGKNNAWRTPVQSDQLPATCFSVDPVTGEIRKILKGIEGFIPLSVQFKTKELNQRKADKLNADLGVTRRQVQAMVFGATHGWDTSGADPKNYTIGGNFLLA